MVRHRGLGHTGTLSAKETAERLRSIKNPFIRCLTSSLNKASSASPKKAAFVASYPFGAPIAQWSQGHPLSFELVSPCGKTAKRCPACAEMDRACAAGMPLVVVLRNGIEVYADTAFFAKLTGQASSLPIGICNPGDLLGPVRSFLSANDRKDCNSAQNEAGLVQANAGARSIHCGVPLGERDLALRLLSLPGFSDCHHYSQELEFEVDSWLFARLLSQPLNNCENIADPWRVEVLVVPENTLRQLFSVDPELETVLMRMVLHETECQLQVSENSRGLMEMIYADNPPAEARPHFKEIVEIVAGSRLGYGAAQDDLLGPFSALHGFIAATGLMKSRTLKNRFPAFIIPKEFSLTQDKPDYFYYSFSRPVSRFRCAPPVRTPRVMEAVAREMSRLRQTAKLPALDFQFVASEKQPKAAVAIRPFTGNGQVAQDFAEQLKFAESAFGLDKSTALGDPRSGFLGHFVRVSNQAKDTGSNFHSVGKLQEVPSHPSLKTALRRMP